MGLTAPPTRFDAHVERVDDRHFGALQVGLKSLHAEASHQRPFLIGRGWLLTVPQLM